MGVSIATHDNAPLPRSITLTLQCDVASAIFCRGSEAFQSPHGFVGCHTAAIGKGWLERQTSQGRIWLCPECSGKRWGSI